MGKLIDADALIKAVGQRMDELYERHQKGATFPSMSRIYGMGDALAMIDEQPTVEAIPVEYIERTMNRWKEIIGYEESVEALRILIDNWKIERKEE